MFTKVVSRATAAADKVEEKAFKKAAKLVAGKAVKHADSLGKMVEKTGEKAMICGLNVLEEKIQTQPQKEVIIIKRSGLSRCNWKTNQGLLGAEQHCLAACSARSGRQRATNAQLNL